MNKPICWITIVDEVNVTIKGLRDEHVLHLHKEWAIDVPGAFFQPKFKTGAWDGKARFFFKNGQTTLYIAEQIIPQIHKWGYDMKLRDLRDSVLVDVEPIDENLFSQYEIAPGAGPIVLRKHQVEGVNALLEYGNGILIAATGAGKSLCTAAISLRYNQKNVKVLTIVPNKDLIAQTKATYANVGLDVGEYSGVCKDIDHMSVVSTWQALQKNQLLVTGFGCIIVDEAQGLKGPSLQSILIDHAVRTPYRFGVTGTLPKDASDYLKVHIATGPIRYTVNAAELIDKGILANLHINVMMLEEDLRVQYQRFLDEDCIGKPPTYAEFKDGYFADYMAEKSYIQKRQPRNEWIARKIMLERDATDGNILVLVNAIDYGRVLAKLIPNSLFVNGTDITNSKKRKEVYDKFKTENGLIVFATFSIASTGIDIPRIHKLFLLDCGKSFVRVIQSIGRGLRKAADKDEVVIFDICSDLKFGKTHSRERARYYTEAKYPHTKKKIDYKTKNPVVES